VSSERIAEINAWARDHPAIFICGMHRSGTTRLHAVFQSAPAFRRSDGRVIESTVTRNLHLMDTWRDSEPLARFLRVPAIETTPLDTVLGATRSWPSDWRVPLLVRAFFFTAVRRFQVARLADKTPGHERHAALLKNSFPRARFVYIVRHPLDVFASARSVLKRQQDRNLGEYAVAPWRWSPDEFGQAWANSVMAGHQLHEAMPGEVTSIRYEDFVAEPEAVMRQVFAFAGAPFEPDFLMSGDDAARWGDWEPKLKDPIGPTGSHWRDQVSPDEAAAVQKASEPMLSSIGYTPYNTDP